ncbi:MAG: hypothetical protein JWR88_1311 [Pseudonocardia sp.]|nr:hypothetical protein [Pseudonocardia sp.]
MLDLETFATALAGAVGQELDGGAARICQLCVSSLPVAGAAVAVMAHVNRREVVYASDDVANELEELQFSLGEGPCVEAFGSGRPVLVADLALVVDPRWPMFAAAAARTTARAAYAFPLQIGAIGIGVLDLYRVRSGLLDADQLAGALMAADAIMWSLLRLRAGVGTDDGRARDARWLTEGRRSHAVVHQATGMIMVQAGADAEAALATLRAFAFLNDRLIDEVAGEVVERQLRFDKESD